MKRFLLLPLSLLFAMPAAADDFGVRLGGGVEKKLSKQFSIDAGYEMRIEDKVSQFTRHDFSIGADYKPLHWLGLGVGYVFIHDRVAEEAKVDLKNSTGAFNGYNVDAAYWRNRHRVVLDATGKWSAGRFTFALRERYQFTHYMKATTERTKYRDLVPEGMDGYTGDRFTYAGQDFGRREVVTNEKEAKNRHYLRSRLGVEYNIRHCPFTPYASYELSNNLNEQWHLDKQRLIVGVEWKITKQHRLDFGYLYDNGHDDDADSDVHALTLSYQFKF